MKTRSLLTATLLSLASLSASAHSLWIEELPGSAGLGIRFAEWGDDFETSPGHLDSLVQVSGWTLDAQGTPTLLNPPKKADHFLLGPVDTTRPAFAQAHFIVRKLRDDKPARAPTFYCRWQPSVDWQAGQPALILDLVPTSTPGEARVFFRGKPLPAAEVLFFSPKVSGEKLTADAEGRVRAPDMSQPGHYLLAISRYSEELPGFFNGVPYAITSHSSSLYWHIKAP